MIVFKNVYKSFKDKNALTDISFHIKENECVGLIGENGAGKTTLLNIALGKIKQTSGFLSVLGTDDIKRQKDILKKTAFVSSEYSNLWTDIPIKHSFDNCAKMYNIPTEEYKSRLVKLCGMMNIDSLSDKKISEMSFGNRIKSEMVYALLASPKLLILDEATVGIDVSSRELILDYLKKLRNEQSTTIIFSSHCLNDIERFCGRVLLLNSSRLIYDGASSELIKRYSKTASMKIKYKGRIPDFEDLPIEKYIINSGELEIIFDRNKITSAEIIRSIKPGIFIYDIEYVHSSLESTVKQIYKEREKTND